VKYDRRSIAADTRHLQRLSSSVENGDSPQLHVYNRDFSIAADVESEWPGHFTWALPVSADRT
jgi:hypothetical protein